MLRCCSLRFVLSTLSARLFSQLNSSVNNDLIRLSAFSIFALFALLGTNQVHTYVEDAFAVVNTGGEEALHQPPHRCTAKLCLATVPSRDVVTRRAVRRSRAGQSG